MNKKFLPILLTIIPFAWFVLFRQYVLYPDSFDYLGFVCNHTALTSGSQIETLLFSWIPCNLLAIKIILFCLSALSLYAIMKTSEFWHKDNAYWTGLICIMNPFWYIIFFQFENDQFAYPFLFAALYFFVRAKFTKNKWNYLATVLSIIIAGTIWNVSIVFLVALGLMNTFFLLPVALIIAYLPSQAIYLLFAYRTQAIENSFGYGLLMLNWFIFGILRIPKQLLWPTLFLIIVGILNAKLTPFAIPFLAIGWTYAITNLETNPKKEKYKKIGIMLIGLLQILIILFSFAGQQPTNQDWQNFKQFENYKPEIQHRNDFGQGYYLRFLGYTPSAISGGSFTQTFENSIALTVQDLNCPKIKDFDYVPFINEKIGYAIYDCT